MIHTSHAKIPDIIVKTSFDGETVDDSDTYVGFCQYNEEEEHCYWTMKWLGQLGDELVQYRLRRYFRLLVTCSPSFYV